MQNILHLSPVFFLINHYASLHYLQTLVIHTTGITKQVVSASSFQIYLLQDNASVQYSHIRQVSIVCFSI